jgi:hypothetical protein
MDAVSIEQGTGKTEFINSQPTEGGKVRRVLISDQHYYVEVYEDDFRQTWVKVSTGDYVSRPIPFRDFVVGNQ